MVDLRGVCEDQNPIKTSIYFQECEEVDYHDKEAFADGTMTITMSAFSTPTNSRFGPIYEIPRVQCSRKNGKSTKLAENHSRVIPLGNGKQQLIQDDAKQGYTIFVVCGSGLAGLVGGILITLLTCIRVQKCKDRSNNSDGLLSRSNTNLISEGEGHSSIHSNENLDVYHYIDDVSDQKEGNSLFNVIETVVYDYATEQQCKENLRNSTSGQGNPSESVQVYHTLSKDLKVVSEKPEQFLATVSDSMYTQNDLRYEDVFQMSSENQRCISYEENWNQSVIPEKSLPPETHERVSSVVYYALKKNGELNSTASLNDTTTELYVNSATDAK
uniref:Uncharacterized protein LOC111110466 n=1 Tax=Crassostrea virginica TaxID=6565 RepID=A0A8B8BHD5_CRAVI|nr:uncharacterized protein LOC111110466 [Crassostrea virginica]